MPCSDPLSLYIPPSPQPKILCLYAQIRKKKKKKNSMFSDGKVVENAFRLNIPSDPRMVDIHLFVCITLVKKKKKNHSISLPHVNPSNTLTFLTHFQFHSQP